MQLSQPAQLAALCRHHAEKNTTPNLLKARYAGRVTSLFAPLGKRGGTCVRQAQYRGRPATTLSGQSLISGQIFLTSLDGKPRRRYLSRAARLTRFFRCPAACCAHSYAQDSLAAWRPSTCERFPPAERWNGEAVQAQPSCATDRAGAAARHAKTRCRAGIGRICPLRARTSRRALVHATALAALITALTFAVAASASIPTPNTWPPSGRTQCRYATVRASGSRRSACSW